MTVCSNDKGTSSKLMNVDDLLYSLSIVLMNNS